MKKSLLFFLLALSFYFSQAQSVISGAITTSDPTFNRPTEGAPPTSLSTDGSNVRYDVLTVTITTPGLNTFVCSGPDDNFDTFGFLYSPAGFDPANPLSNILVGDDDSGPNVKFALTYNFTVPGVYYIVVCPFKNPSTGTYSITTTSGGVLPVRLISFTAEKANSGKNLLKWTSAGESNIEKYQVQHSSNGSNFTDIAGATIDARNVSTNSYYNYTDNSPFEKLNFYRLKIIEKGSAIKYSIVAVVNNNKQSNARISIFPNPAINYLNIQTKAGQKGRADVSISSASGQIVYKKEYTVANESILYIDVQKLAPGNYFVRLKSPDGETTNLPFVKH
jgi:hypothetical protein